MIIKLPIYSILVIIFELAIHFLSATHFAYWSGWLRFKQQPSMIQPYSLNSLAETGRVDVDSLTSVPPGCEKLKLAGVLSLHLSTNYISRPSTALLFKTKLWGREEEELAFRRLDEKEAVLQLAIRSSIETASKYFSDMAVLCIDCYTSGKEDHKDPLKARDYTLYGRIYISIKRYVVSFTLCDFEETFPIIDHRKNKVGEVAGRLTIEPARSHTLYPAATQPEIRHDRFHSANVSARPSHDYSPSIPVRMPEKKDSFQHQHAEFPERREVARNSLDEMEGKRNTMIEHASRPDSNQEDLIWKTDRRKGKAAIFLEEYNRNKPQQSDLSAIRSKYGYNCPSIEVMKLKLDEAILLSNHQQSTFRDGNRANLLLKSIKNHGKGLIDSLVVLYQQGKQQLKTETRILLGQQFNNKIEINHLYVLQTMKAEDVLAFEIKDARVEANMAQLKDKNSIELKAKNGKKVATLQFAFIQERFVPPSNIPAKQPRQSLDKKQDVPVVRVKDSCFLKVEGWSSGHVILRNKKIGVVNGPKIMYEIESEEQATVEIELSSGKDRHFIKTGIGHLFKEENFIVDGRQVKAISARGDLPGLLALVSKIDAAPSKAEKTEKSEQQSVDVKDIAIVFQALEKCENEECNQLMQSLSRQFTRRKLQKLAKLISVDAQLLQSMIRQIFSSNFDRFSQAFLTYHGWNHRYISSQRKVERIIDGNVYSNDLRKAVKRLKRSSEVVFGIVSSSAFMNEFLRRGERAVTEQTESEFNREELGKLIVLLLERYPNKCIKLSELQSFVNEPRTCLHLNAYLLSKMAQEIVSDQDSFEEFLTANQWNLIEVVRSDCDGEWGLAKLLLTNQEEMGQSSTISVPESERRATEQVHEGEVAHRVRTELSKGEEKAQPEEQIHHERTQQHEARESITIILSSLVLSDIDAIQEIQIFSQHQGIKLQRDQLIFPRAIELLKDSTNTVIVTTINEIFEGVFIANIRPQNVKLFNNGSEAGVLKLFSEASKPKTSFDDEQIIVRIQDAEMRPVPPREVLSRQEQEEAEIKCITPIAKSPFVRLTIRSIRPTRPHYKLLVSSDSQRRSLNFPNENEIILKNSEDGWRMQMVDQEVEDIIVTNHIVSSPYCFVERRDQRVVFSAVIEVEECWDPELSLGLKQSLHLIFHFDEILAVKALDEGEYALILESEPQLPGIQFHNRAASEKVSIYQSVVAQSPPERVVIKLIKLSTKQEVVSFRLALKLVEGGIARSTRYLISSVKGFRLNVTIFQIRHSWEYCRPDRVLALFNSQSRRAIQSWIRSTAEITQERLIAWLKANFQLALSEINILLEQLLHSESGNPVSAFLEAFREESKIYMENLGEVKDQFSVFDYNDEGTVSEEQLRIAKKVFNRSFKKFYAFLMEHQVAFIPSPQLHHNFIIDLSPAIRTNFFDYLSLLDLLEGNQREDTGFDNRQRQQAQHDLKEASKGGYLSIRIMEFQNLSINKLPCTFLFKVNDQVLGEPIHKCYSFKYHASSQVTVPTKPPPQLHISLQTLKPNGTWDYKLLQTLPLTEHVRVFGGSIRFALQSTDQSDLIANKSKGKGQHASNENYDHNRAKPQPIEKYQSPKKNHDDRSFSESMNKQFSKSFWNKSLNQTRQKWSQWKQGKKGEKQIRQQLNYNEKALNSEQQY